MGFRRKGSSSTTESESDHHANVIWHNVGIPCPNTAEEALLEANYAAYYQSDTYNEISAVAADLPVAHPTLDPGSTDYIGYPMQRPSFAHILPIEDQQEYAPEQIVPAAPVEESAPEQTSNNEINTCPVHGQQPEWPGKFDPAGFSNWGNIPGTNNIDHFRSKSDAGVEHAPIVELPVRSRSDAGHRTSLIPFDLSTPWNPTFPPYSKYYQPPIRKSPEQEQEEDQSGIGRPVAHEGNQYRLSELIDPADLVPEQDRYDAFSISTASYSSRSSSLDRGSSRSVSPASSLGSRAGTRKISLPDNKPLPPVLESPAGALFSTSEFVAHPNRPLAIRERQEQIRAAIQNLDSETRLARSASRKGSADSQWKTGFGCDSRKGSKSSAASGLAGTAYGGFGTDNRGNATGGAPMMTLEQIKIEEGRRAYEAKKEKGERSWGLSALRGRRGS